MMMKQRVLSVVLLVAIAFAASMVLTGRMRDANEATAQNPQRNGPVQVNTPAPIRPGSTLADFTSVAERTVPAVVNISAKQIVRQRYYNPLDEFLYGRGIRSQRR